MTLLTHPSVAVRELALWTLAPFADPAVAPGLMFRDVGTTDTPEYKAFVRRWDTRAQEILNRGMAGPAGSTKKPPDAFERPGFLTDKGPRPPAKGSDPAEPKPAAEKLVGTWRFAAGTTITFPEGGTFTQDPPRGAFLQGQLGGTYKVDGDKLSLNYEGGPMVNLKVTFSGDELQPEDYRTRKKEKLTRDGR